MSRRAEKARIDARIAELESHQDGRRDRIREIKAVIKHKQLEIDNLKAQRKTMDEAPPAAPASRAGLTACP